MLNGINNNNELNNKDLANISGISASQAQNAYQKIDSGLLIDETSISNEALKLYEHEQDVQKFTALVLSNPQDTSHEEIMSSLFEKGVTDVLSDEILTEIVNNKEFLEDLGL